MLIAGKSVLPIRTGRDKALHWSSQDSRDIHVTLWLYNGVLHKFLTLLNIIDVMINVIALQDLHSGRLALAVRL